MAEENQSDSPNYNQPSWLVETVNQTVVNNPPPESGNNSPKRPTRAQILWGIGAVVIGLLLAALFAPADSSFGWVQATIDQRACRSRPAEQPCIVVARLSPGRGEASGQVTNLLTNNLRRAIESSGYRVVAARSVPDRPTALALARRYAAPLIVWGEVYAFNDLNARVHLEVVDRLGIAQGGELEPFRLQHFPVASPSLTADIPCEGEAGCLGTENGRLVQSAPAVARLAIGLADYSLRHVAQARTALDPLAQCVLDEADPACVDPALLPFLDDQTRSLLLYYTGRSYGMQQDYAEALAYLQASSALAPDNPAPLIAAGWLYQNWGGVVVPAEAGAAFAQAQKLLGGECRTDDSGTDVGERLYSLGVIHELQGQWPQAEECYRLAADALTARKADPYAVLINLARAQRFGGHAPAALATLAQTEKLVPSLPWAALELARVAGENEAEARAHLERAEALAPNTLQLHITRAELCMRWGDFACAEAAYTTARNLRPDYSWLPVKIGEFYRQREEWAQAQASLEEAIGLGASNPWVYEGLGFVLLRQEQWQEAAAAYTQAVQLAYSDESVRHLFCPTSSLLASLQQDDPDLLQKCVEWSGDESQRAWAEQRLQELAP
jgi:tetratricopeptide (TPR) repeat protein